MLSRQQLGVDVGSSWVRISVRGKGIVLREPSVVALAGTQVVAVGDEAVRESADAPETVTTLRPLRDGFAADHDLVAAMLRALLGRVVGASSRFSSPDIILSPSSGASGAEREAALKVVHEVAHDVSLIEAPLAAALGAGASTGGTGSLVVNIGGSTSDVAFVRDGNVVVAETLRSAGYVCDEAIVRLARARNKVLIGEDTAEAVKLELGAAILDASDPVAAERTEKIRGRDLTSGTPKTAHLAAQEVTDVLRELLRKVAAGVRRVLEALPPELAADVVNGGVVLTGGGARLRNSAEFFRQQTGLPVRLADNPADCVVLGVSRAFEHPNWRSAISEPSSDKR